MPVSPLIVPRRNFLKSAIGLTVAGRQLPIPLLLAETPEARIAHHLAELCRAIEALYPESRFAATMRWRHPLQHGPLTAGEFVAVITAGGAAFHADRG